MIHEGAVLDAIHVYARIRDRFDRIDLQVTVLDDQQAQPPSPALQRRYMNASRAADLAHEYLDHTLEAAALQKALAYLHEFGVLDAELFDNCE